MKRDPWIVKRDPMDRETGAPTAQTTTVAVGPDPIEIRVHDLRHVYETAAGALTVLDGVTAEIGRGQIVAIMGSSGSGKTTLLSLLGGLEAPQAGSIEVAGRALDAMSGNELAAFRRETVGFVFQDFGLLGPAHCTRERRARARRSAAPAACNGALVRANCSPRSGSRRASTTGRTR